MTLNELEQALNYEFSDRNLINTALTHPSYGSDRHVPNYQRLEFLGDAVLELAISRLLYYELPNVDEGRLTRLRAELVREETLYKVARRLGLGAYIRLSMGEIRSGGRDKPSILSDVMEAVIAAVYLDGGTDKAFELVKRLYDGMLDLSALTDSLDAKTRLQEILQKDGGMPRYEMISHEGPPHAPIFTYSVWFGDTELGVGQGRSKQAAQQAAAGAALKKIGEKN